MKQARHSPAEGTQGRKPSLRFSSMFERDLLPDWLIRFAIRRLLARRLREEDLGDPEANQEKLSRLVASLKASPIAVGTEAANAQHYMLPPEFFRIILGPRLKYSAGYWPAGVTTLEGSEEAMLRLVCERARLMDGQTVLDLGCGWGALSLYLAERFPNSRIVGVSNSSAQRAFIETMIKRHGFRNVEILTADMNTFDTDRKFDRVVSVEMFEHMRNYERLLARIASWMAPQGLLFVHFFAHTRFAYLFEDRDESDWMARYFFTGGIMPSADLLHRFQNDLQVAETWRLDGTHYRKTAEAWVEKMDAHRAELEPILERTYGQDQSLKWWVYWRTLFLAGAELFGYRGGREWIVAHDLFEKHASL